METHTQIKKNKYDKLYDRYEAMHREFVEVREKINFASTEKERGSLQRRYEKMLPYFAILTDRLAKLCEFSNYIQTSELQQKNIENLDIMQKSLKQTFQNIEAELRRAVEEEKEHWKKATEKEIHGENEQRLLFMYLIIKEFTEKNQLIHLDIKKHTPAEKDSFEFYNEIISRLPIVEYSKKAAAKLSRFKQELYLKNDFLLNLARKYDFIYDYTETMIVCDSESKFSDDDKQLLKVYNIAILYRVPKVAQSCPKPELITDKY